MHRMQIVTINSWPLDRQSIVEMISRRVRYKNASNARRWIAIGYFRCVSVGFNLSCYNPFDQWLRLNRCANESDHATYPHALSDDRDLIVRSDVPPCATSHLAFDHRSRSMRRSRLRHISCALIKFRKVNL